MARCSGRRCGETASYSVEEAGGCRMTVLSAGGMRGKRWLVRLRRMRRRIVWGAVLLVVVLAAGAALRYRRMEALLERVDATIEADARQALRTLDSFDRRQLYGAEQRARFALLYTQAQDKNYVEVRDDSLIRAAVDYYETTNDAPLDKFRALYYLGRVQFNRGEFSRAMLAYLEAERLVDAVADDYLIGLLYVQMGNIYKIYYDYPKALRAYETAYDHYRKTNRTAHQNYALLDMGLALRHMKEYADSEKTFSAVLSRATACADTTLMEYCYGNLIIQYNEQQRYGEAYRLYDTLVNRIGVRHTQSPTFLASVACMYAYLDDMDMAQSCLERAGAASRSRFDSVYLHYFSARIFRKSRQDGEAYWHLGESVQLQDSVLRRVLQQPILSTQRDFLANKLAYQAYRMRVDRRLRWIYTGLAAAAVAALLVVLQLRLRRKDALIAYYMATAGELQETLNREQTEAERRIALLFKENFQMINDLGNAYYEQPNDAKRKDRIYREVKKKIYELRHDPKRIETLETIVNECKQGALRYLREEFPSFKESDYRQLCYHFSGLSVHVVGMLMELSEANVYKRRSRMRAIFQASNAPHRDLFLNLLQAKC